MWYRMSDRRRREVTPSSMSDPWQLNNLTQQSTHPEIQYADHQCAHFSDDAKHSHEVAAEPIV